MLVAGIFCVTLDQLVRNSSLSQTRTEETRLEDNCGSGQWGVEVFPPSFYVSKTVEADCLHTYCRSI